VSLYSFLAMDFSPFVLSRRARRLPLAFVGVALLTILIVCGLASPLLTPYNPAAVDLIHRLQNPSLAHWAGTNELGRDTLARLEMGR
jgi:peptide/nickel transport system permease protein